MCGIAFVQDSSPHPDSESLMVDAILAAYNLQHRGQDGMGIAFASDSKVHTVVKELGLVSSIMTPQRQKEFVGHRPRKFTIHTRYSTTGDAESTVNYQPHYIDLLSDGRVTYAANGDFPNFPILQEQLLAKGLENPLSDNDGEFTLRYICYLKQNFNPSWIGAIRAFMEKAPGAYSGVLMTRKEAFIFRDPWGFRPLVFGKKDNRLMFASESTALDIAGYRYEGERQIQPGEIVHVTNDGKVAFHEFAGIPPKQSFCIFERVYFSRPDSKLLIQGELADADAEIGSYRAQLGKQLAREHPADADIVVSLPSSGDFAWMGYARESGIKPYMIFARNFYIMRTFIMSTQQERDFLIKLKFALMRSPLKRHKRVVLVDDSIVRGSTMKGIVSELREAGATEVHLRITFPPIIKPCFMGINMKTQDELIASQMSLQEMEAYLGVTSLRFISPDGLAAVEQKFGGSIEKCCTACFSGEYPISPILKP